MTTALLLAALMQVRYELFAPTKAPRTERVLFMTMNNCTHCDRANRELRAYMEPTGWEFGGPTAHIEIVNYNLNQQMFARHPTAEVPTFILIRDGKEVRRVPYKDKRTIVELWPDAVRDVAPPPK